MNKVISLLGPTASGKTEFAIILKKNFDLEIISIDSVMIYKHFNIGAAKPNESILKKIPHKMVNIIEPFEKFSVAKFYSNLLDCINEAHSKGKVPILVGGSMMYFKTFFSGGLSDLENVSESTKSKVQEIFASKDLENIYDFLKKLDPLIAKNIHPNDKYRIARMLEIYFSNNEIPSIALSRCSKNVQCFNNLNLSIIPSDRSLLHNNIEKRTNIMIEMGLIDEVLDIRNKYPKQVLPAMSSIGYKQVNQYLLNDIDLLSMKSKIMAATRQLAKRQITWLRHLDATTVYTSIDYDNIESRVRDFLKS